MKVLDYSFARPDPAQIVSEGFGGVMRYLSPNAGKNLTNEECNNLRSHGLAIGLVWEWYANRANEGKQAGVEDARAALNQARDLGFPDYCPIYFAVDWDASEAQQGNINNYFEGVREVFSGRKLGVYGGYYVVKRLFDAQLINYGWQTYAWSGGQWDPRAQLRQTLNGQWSGQVDFGESTQDDWGGWAADRPAQPHPDPTPAPAPAGTHDYAIQKGDTFWGLEVTNGWTHGTIQNLNPGVDPTKLQIGQTVKVPGQAATGNPISLSPTTGQYKIKSGDTFWGLEAQNGWQHGTLQGLNPGVNARALAVGETINIPGSGKASPAVSGTASHTIVSGDTFWALEAANGWAHGTLQGLNPSVEPTALQIGQQIKIPS